MKKCKGKDKAEFIFEHGKWTYTIERIVSKSRYGKASHVFLEISSEGNPSSTWKMEDFTPSNP